MGITKRQKAAVLQTLEHALVAVRTIPNSALVGFLPKLRKAQALLAAEITDWETRQDGGKRYSAHVRRSSLVQISAAIEEIDRLGDSMNDTLTVSGTRAAEAGLTAMQKQLTGLNAMFEGAMVPVSIERALVLDRGKKVLMAKYPASAARYAGEIRKDIQSRMAIGVLQQKTISEMAAAMHAEIPQIFNGARYRAMRLIRTEVMNSYNDAHLEGLILAHQDDSDVKMRWDASYDHRRCPECADLDGKIVDVEGEFKASWRTASGASRGSTNRRPPAHPQCRCVLVPWIEDWPDTDWNTSPPSEGEAAPEASRLFVGGRALPEP